LFWARRDREIWDDKAKQQQAASTTEIVSGSGPDHKSILFGLLIVKFYRQEIILKMIYLIHIFRALLEIARYFFRSVILKIPVSSLNYAVVLSILTFHL
jgi:hypothetical protein